MSVTFAELSDKEQLETGDILSPKFDANGLIPAIAADVETGTILMMAWMNREALARTIETDEVHYWSRSRGELWHKGATSGHIQRVHEIRIDCDQDALLLYVTQEGPGCCHVGYNACFFRRVEKDGDSVKLATIGSRAYDPKAVYGSKGG